jgi:hypothetical protein
MPALAGCVHKNTDEEVIGRSTRPEGASHPITFAFDSLDARPVTNASVAGKPAVIAFVTTWDLSSQAQVDFLVPMAKKDGASVAYVLVALQGRRDRELVEVYASQLGVKFPVALADDGVLGADGPFGDVKTVPTVVILDRAGRMVWRHVGLARSEEIREGLGGL